MKNSEFAELIAYIAKRMYMCGAETRLIVQTSERVAKAYGHQASVVVTPGFIGVSLKCPASGGNDSEPAEECSSFAKIEHGGLITWLPIPVSAGRRNMVCSLRTN